MSEPVGYSKSTYAGLKVMVVEDDVSSRNTPRPRIVINGAWAERMPISPSCAGAVCSTVTGASARPLRSGASERPRRASDTEPPPHGRPN